MSNELKQFLGSNVGKRLMAMAQKENDEFQMKLNGQREKIADIKGGINFLIHGDAQNINPVMLLDGNPVLLATNEKSRIVSAEMVTNENFKNLNANQQASIKDQSPTTYQRLKHGAFQANTSDRFFGLMAVAEEGERLDILYSLEKAPVFDSNSHRYDPFAGMHYDSAEEMAGDVPVPSKVKRLREALTVQNIRELQMEQMALEKHLKESEKANEFLPFEGVLAAMEKQDQIEKYGASELVNAPEIATQGGAE